MVRHIARSEIERVAEVLAAAFETDPFSRWMFGPDDGLRRRLEIAFRTLMRVAYLPKRHAYTTDDLAGAALWAPPGAWKLSFLQQLRLAPAFLRLLGPRRLARAAPAGRAVDRAHPTQKHWYLSVIGVAPDRQRTGIGATLLRPILDRADADALLTHLETSNVENVPYYERHGFRVTQELDVPGDGPHLWFMTRDPRPPRGPVS